MYETGEAFFYILKRGLLFHLSFSVVCAVLSLLGTVVQNSKSSYLHTIVHSTHS